MTKEETMFTSQARDNEKRNGVRHARKSVQAAIDDTKEELEDIARNAGQHVRRLIDNAEENISEATGAVAERIRGNPVQSSLIALGIGFVAGMLFRR